MPCQYVNLNIDGILTKKKITVGCEYTNKARKWKTNEQRNGRRTIVRVLFTTLWMIRIKKEEEKPRKLHRRVYGCVCGVERIEDRGGGGCKDYLWYILEYPCILRKKKKEKIERNRLCAQITCDKKTGVEVTDRVTSTEVPPIPDSQVSAPTKPLNQSSAFRDMTNSLQINLPLSRIAAALCRVIRGKASGSPLLRHIYQPLRSRIEEQGEAGEKERKQALGVTNLKRTMQNGIPFVLHSIVTQ